MKIEARQGNIILGVASVISGALILVLSKVQNLQLIQASKMGPGFFPTLCGIAILACGIGIVSGHLRKHKISKANNPEQEEKTEKEEQEEQENIVNVNELKNLALFGVLGIMVLLLAEYIGLLTCLGIAVFAYLKIQGKESWRKSILVGVGMTVFLYLVFVLFLQVPVPTGIIEF